MNKVEKIQREACAKYGVTLEDMLGKRRDQRVVAARRWAIKRAYAETGLSTTRLGWAFRRDHCTVLYHLGRIGMGDYRGRATGEPGALGGLRWGRD